MTVANLNRPRRFRDKVTKVAVHVSTFTLGFLTALGTSVLLYVITERPNQTPTEILKSENDSAHHWDPDGGIYWDHDDTEPSEPCHDEEVQFTNA